MNRALAAAASALVLVAAVSGGLPARAQEPIVNKPGTAPLIETTIHGAPFTIQAQERLRQNGFVVLGDVTAHDIAAAYPEHGGEPPIFVTTDALLQAWFSLSRTRLESAEMTVFAPHLARALPLLMENAIAFRQHEGVSLPPDDHAALRSAIVTLAVAERLIADSKVPMRVLPADLLSVVNREVDRVRAHDLMQTYPGEDYTLYTPRGHYADDSALTRYFQTSLWLSRRFGNVDFDAQAGGDAGLKKAIALAAIFRAAPASARAEIAALNRARTSLSGPPNAVATSDLLAALDRTLGAKWTLSSATKPLSLQRLRAELGRPAYATTRIAVRQMPPSRQIPREIVSLLPSSAIPDGALFQATGNPVVPNRKLPTGVEVAAALGASVARREIRQQEPQFARPILAAVDTFAPKMVRDDGVTVYGGWLHALATLSADPPPNAPRYMRSGDAWRYEKLNTVLGGWSELRHTFQLYAEHPAYGAGSLREYPPALVEANPAFFDTMASLADRMATALGPNPALARYAAECRTLAADARLELQTGTLPARESAALSHFGEWLLRSPNGEAALVADVATGEDGNVLHAATGNLNLILVQPTGPNGPTCQGWVLSYYEFTRSPGDRMTDARWRTAVNNPFVAPVRPNWAHYFLADSATSGKEWESRAPIRAAVLLLDKQPTGGLAALRQIVAANQDATVGTDAQFAIGRYLYGIGKLREARFALQKCLDLPGGDSYDAAKALDIRIGYEQTSLILSRSGKSAPTPDYRETLRSIAAALAQPATTAEEEKQLTIDFLKALRKLPDASPEIVFAAAVSCPAAVCREVLEYRALGLQSRKVAPDAQGRFVRRCITFAMHATHSELTRIGAFALAVDHGYLKDNPVGLLDAARPFADAITKKESGGEAADLLGLLRSEYEQTEWDVTTRAFADALRDARDRRALAAFYKGRSREAEEIIDRFHGENDEYPAGVNDDFNRFQYLRKQLKDAKEEAALDLIGQAENALQDGNKVAAACFLTRIAYEHPKSRLAAAGLYRAAALFDQTNDKPAAAQVRQKLNADYPQNFDAARRAIEANFRLFDADTFDTLYQAYDSAIKSTTYAAIAQLYGVVEEDDPSESETFATVDWRLREIKPLLDAARAAGTPLHPTLDQFTGDDARLAHQLVEAMPERHEEILRIYLHACDNADMARESLTLYPSGEGVGTALEKLLYGRHRAKTEVEAMATILVVEPYIERGGDFKEANLALEVLNELLGHGAAKDDLLGTVAASAHWVRAQYPNTRTAFAADTYLAQLQLKNDRPEAALAGIQKLLAAASVFTVNDSLRTNAHTIARTAQELIAAKRRRFEADEKSVLGVAASPLLPE